MRRTLMTLLVVGAAACLARAQNGYTATVLVANDAAYDPLVLVDSLIQNGWGVALRPPGAGGHFWVSNAGSGTTTTYVGDVRNAAGHFTPLYQDSLARVDIGIGSGVGASGGPSAPIPQPTGQVFNVAGTGFVVRGEGITAPAKFIFVTGEGTISGWTERVDPGSGQLLRQTVSVVMVDQSQQFQDERLRFTGCTITDFPTGNRLYVTNWTEERVEVYDDGFQPVAVPEGRFRYPGQPEDFRPWNIQYFHSGPGGEGRLWVTYNRVDDPWEELPDFGAVAEFDLEGNFIRRLFTSIDFDPFADSELRDPWGLALAPADFGPASNKLLVANFGDGTIAVYDPASGLFVDFLRDDQGQVILVDGIWGMTFGNGVALGDANALYFAAGPNGEVDGTFGTVRYTPHTAPRIESQPGSVIACPGVVAQFTVSAPSPVRVGFQWQRETGAGQWADLADGGLPGVGSIAGSMTATLGVSQIEGAARFRCVVTTTGGTEISDAAALSFCYANCDCSSGSPALNVLDFACFLNRFAEGSAVANCDQSTTPPTLNVQDFACFLNAFAVGCP